MSQAQYQKECKQCFGEAVSFDPQITKVYGHDVGEMPDKLMALINNVPHTVIAARSIDDVVEALKLSAKYKVPITPRGQATSGYGGAIPSRGGVILDMSNLNRIFNVDTENATVDVEPGVIWENLSSLLAQNNLAVRICPTSAPSSTVGGWFAMGGVGIGSLRYGSFRENVLEIDAVGLDGEITTYTGEYMDRFYQTCGSLGVITRLRLACRPAENFVPVAFFLPDAASAMHCLKHVKLTLSPYSATLQSASFCKLHAQAGDHDPAIDSGFFLLVSIPEDEADPDQLEGIASLNNGTLLPEHIAEHEWNNRYYPMRLKKLGPSVLVGEYLISCDSFPKCWNAITRRLKKDELALEAVAVNDGTMAVLTYILDDSSSLMYAFRMAKAMIPIQTALRNRGKGYATGKWFSALGKSIYGLDKYRAVRQYKKNNDKYDLINSGLINGPRVHFFTKINISRMILLATSIIAPLAARFSYKNSRV